MSVVISEATKFLLLRDHVSTRAKIVLKVQLGKCIIYNWNSSETFVRSIGV